jgi:uroporphyrinogen-III synthase
MTESALASEEPDNPVIASEERAWQSSVSASQFPKVIVLRDRSQAAVLVDLLAEQGIEAEATAATQILPPVDLTPLREAVERARNGEFAWIVVTSQNAVRALAEAGLFSSGEVPARWAAVGPATGRALEEYGQQVSLVAPKEESNAAGLVAIFPEGVGEERKILLPQGDLADSTLEDGLRERGWIPQPVTAYRTARRQIPEQILELVCSGTPVVCYAPSAVRSLAEQFAEHGLNPTVRTIAIGKTTAAAIHSAGWPDPVIAASPTDEAIAAAIKGILGGMVGGQNS